MGCHPSLIIAPNGPFDIKNLALAALNNVYDGVFQIRLTRVPRSQIRVL